MRTAKKNFGRWTLALLDQPESAISALKPKRGARDSIAILATKNLIERSAATEANPWMEEEATFFGSSLKGFARRT